MDRSLAGPWLPLVLVGALPAGCLGADPSDEDADVTRARAEVSSQLGGIEGTVVDDAIQPILGANVTVVETGRMVRTKADGSFAVSLLRPGTYTLNVNATGFVSASQPVPVIAGSAATVDVVLVHLASTDAYSQVLELVGFFECGVEVGWNVSEVPPPADFFFLGIAVCAVPNAVTEELGLGGNTTNDRFLHEFRLDAPLDTVVYEMEWKPSSQFSQWMTTRMEASGFANDDIGTIFRVEGPSPIRIELTRAEWEQLDEDFRAACAEGDEEYCDHNFFDDGWELQMRVFPAWQCQSQEAGGCVAAQQEFTHYISAFYNGPAPAGHSALA